MFELLSILTGVVIVVGTMSARARSRDPLCPLVIFAPMLFYVYAYRPFVLAESGSLAKLFRGTERLEFVQLVNLLAISCFCAGCQVYTVPRQWWRGRILELNNPIIRQRILKFGMVLAAISVSVFLSMLWATGAEAWTYRKPYLDSPIRSGYYRELINLSFPAVLLTATGWSGTRLTLKKFLVLCIALAPMIYMGTLGGRRGPLFLSLGALAASAMLIRQRRVNFAWVVAGVVAVGVLMVFLQVNRANLFRFWSNDIETRHVADAVVGTNATAGDEYVAGAATILVSTALERNYWGARYAVMYLVRPIPRQLWPTKYEDTGMGWMLTAPGFNGFSIPEWRQVVGFIPQAGSAGGFVSDLFLEFHLGALLGVFLIGLLYNVVWWRSIVYGSLWRLIYLELLILSVYLPAQSVGAWLYRALLIVLPTVVMWKYFVQPILRRQQRAAGARVAATPGTLRWDAGR